MEISVTEFRNNISTYFDKVYFDKEDIILSIKEEDILSLEK